MARTKVCVDCGDEKAVNAFYKHPHTTDGYAGQCKECKKRYSRERYDAKRDAINAERRRRFKEDPVYRARTIAGNVAWKSTQHGKELMREYRKFWAVLNPERNYLIRRTNQLRLDARKKLERRLRRELKNHTAIRGLLPELRDERTDQAA